MVAERYDVVVVGASLAGCVSARMFAESGLRVALLERSADPDAYKAMCGHWILGGAAETLQRVGLWQLMVDAGATVDRPSVWSGDGWIPRGDDVPASITLRRMHLDPLVRQWAASHANVDLRLGHSVTGVVEGEHGRVVGVDAGDSRFTGRLVVGADGFRSPTARLAGVASESAPNNRFLWWAYYEGLDVAAPMIWPADPSGAVVIPAGRGLHLVGAFPSKDDLGAFADDRIAAIEAHLSRQPDAPSLHGATRVSNAIGTSDYPFVRRDPLPRPGLALVGDAATASDPVPAVGCGWAIRSGAWLADAATPALLGDGDLDVALQGYRDARRIIDAYDAMARQDAVVLHATDAQRAVRRAALRDPEIARRIGMFAARAATPDVLLNADTMERVMTLA